MDREAKSWLIDMYRILGVKDSPSGYPVATNDYCFCFYWQGQVYQIYLTKSYKSSGDPKDDPYHVIWAALNNVDINEIEIEKYRKIFHCTDLSILNEQQKEQWLFDLKRALFAYRDRGLIGDKFVTRNIAVSFEF